MFPIQMTFTVSTKAELDRLVAATNGASPVSALAGGNSADPPTEAAVGKSEKAKPAPAEKAKSADTQPTAAAAAAQPSKDNTSTNTLLDYERDVRPRFLALATAPGKGRAAQLKVLELAGCEKKLTEIADTQEGLERALAAVAQVEAE